LMVLARRLAIAAAVFSLGSATVAAAIIAANSPNAPPASAMAALIVSTGIFIVAACLVKLHNAELWGASRAAAQRPARAQCYTILWSEMMVPSRQNPLTCSAQYLVSSPIYAKNGSSCNL